MASATRGKKAKSDATKSSEEKKLTHDKLVKKVRKLEIKLALAESNSKNSVVLNSTRPWLLDPLSTIIPQKVSGEKQMLIVNSLTREFTATIWKVYVLVVDPNDFFFGKKYKAWISDESDAINLRVPAVSGFLVKKPTKFLKDRRSLTSLEKIDFIAKNPGKRLPPFLEPSEAEDNAAGITSNEIKKSMKQSETRELRLTCKDGSKFHNSFAHDGMEENELKLHWKANDVPILDSSGNERSGKDAKKQTQIWAYFYVGIVDTEEELSGDQAPAPTPSDDYMGVFW